MEKTPFAKPSELLHKKDTTEPIQARIKSSNKALLEAEAKKLGKKPAALYGRILDRYAEWLGTQKKK